MAAIWTPCGCTARLHAASGLHDESDIDVLVITGGERDDERLIPILWRVLDEMGNRQILVDPR